MSIFTLGCGSGRKQLGLSVVTAIVDALKIGVVLDWRPDPGRLTPDILRSAFGERYRDVSDRCAADKITEGAINRLAVMKANVLLLFTEEVPADCPRHKDLALVLAARGVKVSHIIDDEVVDATELQRSIDADDSYECEVWKPEPEPVNLPDMKDVTIEKSAPISEQCILVDVTLGGFGNRRKVKTTKVKDGENVTDQGGVLITDGDPKMVRATKSLMDSPELASINTHDGQTRDWIYSRCLPSPFQKGIYLLPIRLFAAVEQYIRTRMAERAQLVTAFVAAIPQRIREAEGLLGNNFNSKDYPTPEEVGERFVFTRQYLEFGVASKLERLSEQVFNEEKAKIERQWQEAGDIAKQALRAGMKTVVDQMVEQLTSKSATGRKKKIYESMLPKLNGFLDLFRDRNIANDHDLETLVATAKQAIKGVDTEALRDNDSVRQFVGQQFQTIRAEVEKLIVDRPKRAYDFEE